MKESRRSGVCCLENCGHERQRRGLCKKHYDAASRLVKNGETTWDKLAEFGKAIVWRGISEEEARKIFLG